MKTALGLLLAVATTSAAQAACFPPWNARFDLRALWLRTDCNYHFPSRDGFAGPSRTAWLKPGTVVDRFGYPGGTFLAPADASYMGRSIPYDRLKMPYYRYEVVRRLRVRSGRIAPWFDQPGGGIQYKTERKVGDLVASGHLRAVW